MTDTVVICDETWRPIAPLALWDDLTMTERLCDVGTGALTAPATAANRELIARGRTLLVKHDSRTVMGGLFTYGEFDQDGSERIRLGWDSPLKYLSGRLTYQSPGSPASVQPAEYDVRSGPASTVILQFAQWAASTLALPNRRVFGLRIGDDPAAGPTITYSARMGNLLDEMRRLAVPNGLKFGIETVDREHILTVEPVRDLSDSVVFSRGLNNVRNLTWTISPPLATVMIAGGKGELSAREFQEVSSPESRAQEARWGRRIEGFFDANNDTGNELRQGALRELEDRGETVEATFDPVDTVDIRYGRDYNLGDLVKVILRPAVGGIPAEVAVKPIREVTTTISRAAGRRVTPTAGDYAATSGTGTAFTLKDVQRQIKAFQRNR